jgi:DNA polymerase-3 subunit delta'
MSVWDEVVGQPDVVGRLQTAAAAAQAQLSGLAVQPGAMTHAWLFTGPPGSGRSVSARAFAASLQCMVGIGCGSCPGCRTTMAGTHADVHNVVTEGLTIPVAEIRAIIQTAARRPVNGRWQVVIVEDSDRLTEGASNALLKSVEEPPERTVFLLCAPSDHPSDVPVTIRSRCRVVGLQVPPAEAVAQVLVERDGIAPELAAWAGSVSSGHVGRARRLATDEESRARRAAVLEIPLGLRRLADVFSRADVLVKSAETEASSVSADRDEDEKAKLRNAMGADGVGKGTAGAKRAAEAAVKQLEKRQKSRSTRTQRDTYDLALIDLANFYRDVLTVSVGATVALNHPDKVDQARQAAAHWTPESTLRRLETVLDTRVNIGRNVKPRIAVEAMLTDLLVLN